MTSTTFQHTPSTSPVAERWTGPPSPVAAPPVVAVRGYNYTFEEFINKLSSYSSSCGSSAHLSRSGIGGLTRDITLRAPVDICTLAESPLEIGGRESKVPDALDHYIPIVWGDFSSVCILPRSRTCVVLGEPTSPYVVIDGLLEKLSQVSGCEIVVHVHICRDGRGSSVMEMRVWSVDEYFTSHVAVRNFLPTMRIMTDDAELKNVVFLYHDIEVMEYVEVMVGLGHHKWSLPMTPSSPVTCISNTGVETMNGMGVPGGHKYSYDIRTIGEGLPKIYADTRRMTLPRMLTTLTGKINTFNCRVKCSRTASGLCVECVMINDLLIALGGSPPPSSTINVSLSLHA